MPGRHRYRLRQLTDEYGPVESRAARGPLRHQGLAALVTKPSGEGTKNWRDGGYIKKLNKDPWGNDYQYQYPGSNAEFDVFSLGADAAVGGEGEAADIGNWNIDS